MKSVGGFQSGFSARRIRREECKFPQFLICNHGCPYVIQLVSHVSGEPEFELCEIEARKMAQVLIEACEPETGHQVTGGITEIEKLQKQVELYQGLYKSAIEREKQWQEKYEKLRNDLLDLMRQLSAKI